MADGGDYDKETVLNVQRLALLVNDTRKLFESDSEACGIGVVLSDSMETYMAVLYDDCNTKSIMPIGEMPRRRA